MSLWIGKRLTLVHIFETEKIVHNNTKQFCTHTKEKLYHKFTIHGSLYPFVHYLLHTQSLHSIYDFTLKHCVYFFSPPSVEKYFLFI